MVLLATQLEMIGEKFGSSQTTQQIGLVTDHLWAKFCPKAIYLADRCSRIGFFMQNSQRIA
jgi:hypothetical protein